MRGPRRERSTQDAPGLRTHWTERAQGEKFPTRRPASPERRTRAAGREEEGFLSPSLGGRRRSDLYAQQVLHLFSAALVSVLVHRLFSLKDRETNGIHFSFFCQTLSRDAEVWREGGGGEI